MRAPIAASRFGGPRARGEEAMALPLAMLITFLVMVLGLAFLEISRMDAVRATSDMEDMQALTAAELGLERARAMANSQKAPWAVMQYNGSYLHFNTSYDPLYGGRQVCNLFTNIAAGGNSSGTYSVVIEDTTGSLLTSGSYRIHSFGTAGTHTHHISMNAQTLTYAAFGWLTNSENSVYFRSGDVVDGWVYTNDQLNIWGTPAFTGKVNSAASSLHYGNGGPPTDNPNFQAGLTLNSPTLNMSALINAGQVAAIRTQALQPTGIWLGANSGRPYSVVFASDGTVTIQKQLSGGSWQTVLSNKALSTTNGAIYIEDTVQVKGTVNGQATLATPSTKDIQIVDDLIYAHPANKLDVYQPGFNPLDPTFTDKLGLVAGQNLIINKPWSGTWTDMYVMGSMLAVTGSFKNQSYTSTPQKRLNLYGGIAQNTRGAVGTVAGAGFLKNYKYDGRFMTEPPPYFPTAMYDFTTWSLDPP